MTLPNLKLFDPGFSDCKHYVKLLSLSKKYQHLFDSQSSKFIANLIIKLTKLRDRSLSLKTQRQDRDINWYRREYQERYTPPRDAPYYYHGDYYNDNESELYNEYQEWEKDMIETVNFETQKNNFVIIKLNYYIDIIQQILLDLNCLISNNHDEIFGTKIDSINDLIPYSYVYINKETTPKLVYIVFIDYDEQEVWYQETKHGSSRDILDYERKWQPNDSAILDKIGFDRVFNIIPNIYPNRKKLKPDLVYKYSLESDYPDLNGFQFNISNGFYKKYINNLGGKFSLQQYFDTCYIITKIEKFVNDPESYVVFETFNDPHDPNSYRVFEYSIPPGYLSLYHQDRLIYDDIKFYDKLLDKHYYDDFIYQ